MSFKGLRARLTYANVMSTVAAFLALTGAATAIAISLPKNSVKSKQLAPGAVKNSDIGKDAVTGDKVKESSLAKVPNATRADSAGRADSAANADHAAAADTASVATTLSGFAPSNLPKTFSTSSSFFITSLSLPVSGFGTFYLACDINGAGIEDDEATFGYSISAKNAIEGGFSSSAGFPLDEPINRVIADEDASGSGTFTNQDDRVYYSYRLAIPGTTRAMLIEASGFDNENNAGCAGQIQAFVIS